ncbi:MAG: NAD-dependent epimerase/dehydratase family protein [Nocardioidaceae bacterium]
MRLLITGAAGHIGSVLADRLTADHELCGVGLLASSGFPGEFVVGDCADTEVARRAVEGTNAVIHLAGIPTESSLPASLHSHVETTAALLDAMVQVGVRRMVYASSNHAVGMTPRVAKLSVETRLRPDTFYGVGKVAAEALLSLYADRYGIASVAMRIGSFLEKPDSKRGLATWLSYDDCERMVRAALTAPLQGYLPIYGISANSDGWWDLASGRAIGYEPQDDAHIYADAIGSRPTDEQEAATVGGPLPTDQFDRRPFDGPSRDD